MNWSDYFCYDESSLTCLRWRVARYTGRGYGRVVVAPAAVAGNANGKGYFDVTLDNVSYRVHRVVWEMFNGTIPIGMQIDHKNGCKTDNRIENLRLVENSVNCRNKGLSKANKTGVVGVYLRERFRYGKYELSWGVTWRTLDGKCKGKSFSCKKYGESEAFRLACEWRTKMIEQLNAEGAGYTDRHGKE